ncbi:MAG: hypothetical protein WCV72_02095 [Patescibacteria group bacterium]
MKEAAKPPYEVDRMQIRSLVEEVDKWKEKSPKVTLEIIRLLEEGVRRWQRVKLSWNLVEAFVDDVCTDPESKDDRSPYCRENIRAIFEDLEEPIGF